MPSAEREMGRMAEIFWHEPGSSDYRLLRVRDAGDLWALGPVEVGRLAVLAVVDGPGWRASWRASRSMPCAAPREEGWRVTDVTVDDNAAPMSTDSLSLPLDVCRLIKKGRHLRLEQRPHDGVTLEDAGVYDSFEDARAWAYHWVQQQVPEQERRHYYGLLDPPDAGSLASSSA